MQPLPVRVPTRSQITFQRLQICQNVVLRVFSKLPRVTTQTLHAHAGVSIVRIGVTRPAASCTLKINFVISLINKYHN